jgi:DNA-binding response OmpR family regulator
LIFQLLIAALGLEETVQKAFGFRSQMILSKPFSPNELIARIKKTCWGIVVRIQKYKSNFGYAFFF